jgi:outer membrane protein assembly factor BamD
MPVTKWAALGLMGLMLAGCSTPSAIKNIFGSSNSDSAGFSGDGVETEATGADSEREAKQLYDQAFAKMKEGEYKSAAKGFSEVERKHPYSNWATKALIMQAFSHYQRASYDDTINSAQRFLTLHPGHKDAPYAHYLTAVSYYDQIADVRRDQTATAKALEALEEVGRRYPGTKYARDAEKKARIARDHLAGKEMEVGRYYLNRGSHLAAINRFKKVVTDYQTSSQTPEALYRLTESYLALGVQSEAQTAAAVLGHNYPNSEWYQDSFSLLKTGGLAPRENRGSWISRAWNSINPL